MQRHLDGRPVRARPTSWSYRAKKFVARNKLVAGAATAVVLSLVIGIGVAGWQAHQARIDQRRAEQVKAFLASIFLDIDPNYGQGARVPASAILLKASSRIDNEFGKDPRLALEVATLVSSGLMNTSQQKPALEIIEAALKRYQASLSPSDPQVLRAQRIAVAAHGWAGTLAQVAPMVPDLVAKLRNTEPLLTEELVQALFYLGAVEFLAGRPESAVAAREEAAELARNRLGEHHKASIEALSHWASMLVLAGKPFEAKGVAERGVTAARAVYQRPHPMLAGLERRLAEALMRSGTPADAAVLLYQVLEDEKAIQGEDAVSVAHAQFYLGNALVFSGQLRAGLHHYSAGTEALVRLTPDDHRNHWARRRNVASAYLAARLPAEALRSLDEAERAATAAGVEEARQSPVPRMLRCVALTMQGRFQASRRGIQGA